jgi:hypothetical protein
MIHFVSYFYEISNIWKNYKANKIDIDRIIKYLNLHHNTNYDS